MPVSRGTPADATREPPRVAEAWIRIYAEPSGMVGIPAAAAVPRGSPNHRSVVDALAAWHRWHDPTAAILYKAESDTSYAAYVAAERARVETLSARQLRGMARNLTTQPVLFPRAPMFARLYRDVRSALETQVADGDVSGLDAHRFAEQWRERILLTSAEFAMTPAAEHDEHSLGSSGDQHRESPPAQRVSDPVNPRQMVTPDNDGSGEEDAAAAEAEAAEQVDDAMEPRPRASDGEAQWFPEYRVFRRTWDQELDASALVQSPEGVSDVDLSLHEDSQLWRHAMEFKRRTLAAHDWRWQFDRPEGQIDPRRLTRLVAGRPPFEIFRVREFLGEMAAVTFLVDQSGSMKGEPQRLTVLTVDLATRVLESLGIPCEILSYTTRFGGQVQEAGARNPVFEAWRAAGSPPNPGRLNAVRHIIIKRFNQPYRQARGNLRVLVAPALGHENVDGEALHWAARRLACRTEPRRVLLVLSDATPLDPATQQANAPLFLEGHLRSVISAVEHSPLRLGAIGIGTRVEAFYRKALTVPRPEDIDRLIFGFLGELLQ